MGKHEKGLESVEIESLETTGVCIEMGVRDGSEIRGSGRVEVRGRNMIGTESGLSLQCLILLSIMITNMKIPSLLFVNSYYKEGTKYLR